MVNRNPAIVEIIQLQEDLSHLLSDLTVRISGEFLGTVNHWTPNVDLSEDANEVVIEAEVPGISPTDLTIVFQEGSLQIKGEKLRPAHQQEQVRYLCLERTYGTFSRTIHLAEAVDVNAARARLRNGVLCITLPKLLNRRTQVRTIPIDPG